MGYRVIFRSECEWTAIVGFKSAPLPWANFGQASFLEFFDIRLLGGRCEALLEQSASLQGRHIVRRPPRP